MIASSLTHLSHVDCPREVIGRHSIAVVRREINLSKQQL